MHVFIYLGVIVKPRPLSVAGLTNSGPALIPSVKPRPLSVASLTNSELALIPSVTPWPLSVAGLTNNNFKNRRLAHQITTSLSCVLHPRSHGAWEIFQEVTHPKIAPQQVRLTVELLRVGFRKERCTFGDISSHFKSLKRNSGCYNHLYLKCVTFSLHLTTWPTGVSSWHAIHQSRVFTPLSYCLRLSRPRAQLTA